MLELKCLGSGSSGNCYLLNTAAETLILDCGIPIKEIKKGLGFDLSRVVGVVAGHEHLDHSRSLKDFEYMGIRRMAPFVVGNVRRSHCTMGSFDITSFDLPHNGVWNSGFLIKIEGQTLLYMTDFEYCPYTFKKQKINHMLIECNYQNKYINTEIANYEHKLRGHCELDVCKEFVKINRTDELKTVILCHLGHGADADECIDEVEKVARCPVYVAEKNSIYELN